MTAGLLVVGSRISFRMLSDVASRYRPTARSALILGAGDRGALVVRELRNNRRYDCRPVAFVDDDQAKQQRKIMGVPVLGTFDDLQRLIAQKQPDLLILSTDKLPPARMSAVRPEPALRPCCREPIRDSGNEALFPHKPCSASHFISRQDSKASRLRRSPS